MENEQLSKAALDMAKKIFDAEEKLLTSALTDFLKRPAITEDFKQCTRMYASGEYRGSYIFCYEHYKLGMVSQEIIDGKVSFSIDSSRTEF